MVTDFMGYSFRLEGQVRSECLMCTFRASCCSTHLSLAQLQGFASSSVQTGKKGGEGLMGTACTGRYKGV